MALELKILKTLSDGHFHSGESLARQLAVSRTTIMNATQKLQQQFAVTIQSVKGRGYRLSQPIELLDSDNIRASLPPVRQASLPEIDILSQVDSTNRYLMAAASQGAPSAKVILAEQQTAGRGRRGRAWISPFGCNLYCSLLWRFDLASSVLSGLGIVIAIAVARSLSDYVEGIEIKWPNDILWQQQKLAGILLEMQGEANGPAAVVIGVGVNIDMPESSRQQIDQACTDLYKASGTRVSRNALAAKLIEQLLLAIAEFESNGLDSFVSSWPQWDMLRDKPVDIVMAKQTIAGIARGIDSSGALQVESAGVVKSYMAGEISLKKQS